LKDDNLIYTQTDDELGGTIMCHKYNSWATKWGCGWDNIWLLTLMPFGIADNAACTIVPPNVYIIMALPSLFDDLLSTLHLL
jgi:hypothetical protein